MSVSGRGGTGATFLDFVLDQLSGLGRVRARSMFGGHGLYLGDTFFGIVYRDRVYFKTDDSTRPEYVRAGMEPFRPNDKQVLTNYYEIPPEVVEDRAELERWADDAVGAGGPGRNRSGSPKPRNRDR